MTKSSSKNHVLLLHAFFTNDPPLLCTYHFSAEFFVSQYKFIALQ